MLERLREYIENPYARAGLILVASVVVAYIAAFIIEKTLGALTRRTASDLDDRIVEHIHRPIVVTLMFLGFGLAFRTLGSSDRANGYISAFLQTVVILLWARAGLHVGTLLLSAFSSRAKERDLIQPRTLPVFDMVAKMTIFSVAVYFVFLAWRIDVTAWLASAGIVGIAVGFAAKDTLANFFAGIFIVADAPYKIGDWIVLDGDTRGKVLSIGIRSTRILTLDDIEITVPNAIIGNSQITNEAGGPWVHQRVRVTVDAAYGSDIDRVHEVLSSIPAEIEDALENPAPYVRFEAFGASGLTHSVYLWIGEPHKRDLVEHRMHTAIYKAFGRAAIEIPYSKHDVYIKAFPRESPSLKVAGTDHLPPNDDGSSAAIDITPTRRARLAPAPSLRGSDRERPRTPVRSRPR